MTCTPLNVTNLGADLGNIQGKAGHDVLLHLTVTFAIGFGPIAPCLVPAAEMALAALRKGESTVNLALLFI